MIHPFTELRFIDEEVGYGVVAKQFIPKGTITWVLDKLDQEFTPDQVRQMDEKYQRILDIYAYRNRIGNFILCWDHARFVNHSFNSNCLTTAYDFEIAVRDIHEGEQLTDDYGYLNISEPFRAKSEGTRRKTVYPDDTLRYYKVWDKQVASAFRHILELDQPLGKMLSDEQWGTIDAVITGQQELESILSTCYRSDA